MNEYRCTRNYPYRHPDCFGHTNLSARQGYYLKAQSEPEAIAMMEREFPDELEWGFTAKFWKDLSKYEQKSV
jgi:hypothetical protein